MQRGVFQNDNWTLVPGLFVRIKAPLGAPRPRLLVEERAVSADQRGDYLLVVDDKNVVEYRPVKLGHDDRRAARRRRWRGAGRLDRGERPAARPARGCRSTRNVEGAATGRGDRGSRRRQTK